MNITIGELFVLMGIPSAVTGIVVWFLKKHVEEKEKKTTDRENSLSEILVAMVASINGTIALCEAIANAVSRIPDAHCNGDMHAALEYVKQVKHAQKDLLEKAGIKSSISE